MKNDILIKALEAVLERLKDDDTVVTEDSHLYMEMGYDQLAIVSAGRMQTYSNGHRHVSMELFMYNPKDNGFAKAMKQLEDNC